MANEPYPQWNLLLIERIHSLLDGAIGVGEAPARHRVIHRRQRLLAEPIGIRGVKRKASTAVECRDEHANGVARRRADFVANESKAVFLVLAELCGNGLGRCCGRYDCSLLQYPTLSDIVYPNCEPKEPSRVYMRRCRPRIQARHLLPQEVRTRAFYSNKLLATCLFHIGHVRHPAAKPIADISSCDLLASNSNSRIRQ